MYSEDYHDPFRDTSEYGHPSRHGYSNGLATASLVLAVISLFSGAAIYISVPCGALAILLALLSRGDRKLPGKCKAAIVLGAAGAISSIIMTVGAFYMIMTNPSLRNDFKQLFNLYANELGLDYDFDDLEDMFGLDQEDGPSNDSDSTDDYYEKFWEEFYSGDSDDHSEDHSQDNDDGLPDSDGTSPIPDDPSIFSGGEFI